MFVCAHTDMATHLRQVQQYLFSQSSCQLLLSELKRLKVMGVVCVGTPRLHEAVQSQLAPAVHSLLLDIDSRYVSYSSLVLPVVVSSSSLGTILWFNLLPTLQYVQWSLL